MVDGTMINKWPHLIISTVYTAPRPFCRSPNNLELLYLHSYSWQHMVVIYATNTIYEIAINVIVPDSNELLKRSPLPSVSGRENNNSTVVSIWRCSLSCLFIHEPIGFGIYLNDSGYTVQKSVNIFEFV